MRDAWTREALEARVDELATRRESFVPSIERLAEGLDERERELLGHVLLARANAEDAFSGGLAQRLEERSWLKRMWARSERRAAELRAADRSRPLER